MYTIAIDDPMIYLDGETFARENHSSLKELVNKYVASLAAKVRLSKQKESKSLSEQEDFQKALAYVKTLTAKGGKPVPADIDPMEVFVQEKYGL